MKIEREYPSFIITKKGSAWVGTGHPWIYAQEIISKKPEPENGALVDALSENGHYLGTGLYSRESKIGLRLISRNANDRFDAEFWKPPHQVRLGLPPARSWAGTFPAAASSSARRTASPA